MEAVGCCCKDEEEDGLGINNVSVPFSYFQLRVVLSACGV